MPIFHSCPGIVATLNKRLRQQLAVPLVETPTPVSEAEGPLSLISSHGWCCQHVSAMHHVPSCIFGPMKTDSGLSQMVGTRKFHQLSPNVHRDFPKLGCSSMFYFTNCCPHEPGSPKPKPKKPAAKAGQTCQFGNPADG